MNVPWGRSALWGRSSNGKTPHRRATVLQKILRTCGAVTLIYPRRFSVRETPCRECYQQYGSDLCISKKPRRATAAEIYQSRYVVRTRLTAASVYQEIRSESLLAFRRTAHFHRRLSQDTSGSFAITIFHNRKLVVTS